MCRKSCAVNQTEAQAERESTSTHYTEIDNVTHIKTTMQDTAGRRSDAFMTLHQESNRIQMHRRE